MTENAEPIVLEGGELSDVISRILVGGVLASLVVAAIGLVQGIRHGFNYDYTIFFAGGILAILALAALPLHSVAVAAGKSRNPSLAGMLVSFGGFLPYVFGLYLILYESLWRLSQLRDGFSVQVILASLLYGLLGIIVLKSVDRASSFARKVTSGEIVLT